MAKCIWCEQEMLTAHSCKPNPIIYKGKEHKQIKMGESRGKYEDLFFGHPEIESCGDCGVRRGGYHHPGCDCETCPVCGEQRLSCDCNEFE